MKIILSRKGFDSGYGRVASPIFPDGSMLSLPIPATAGRPAQQLRFRDQTFGDLIADLTRERLGAATLVHLDPDLEVSVLPRQPGWRPAFGQVGAAQSHLQNQGVGEGDLFLFFGWFRHVDRVGATWLPVRGGDSIHSMFGWLQVDQVIDVNPLAPQQHPTWLHNHPHITHANQFAGQQNTIYVGREQLEVNNGGRAISGGGTFSRWSIALRLTAQGATRSVWSVPTWLEPSGGRRALTYHGNASRWSRRGEELLLASAAIGQEFVLDTDDYPEAVQWARVLIEAHS